MTELGTVLLAEDNADDVILIQTACASAGITQRFEVVENGQEAIRYLDGEGPYHDRVAHPFPVLLLLDLRMPGKDGFAVLQWIRKHPEVQQRLIVLVLTGDASEEATERAWELGARSVLVKPVSLAALTEMMLQVKRDWLEPAYQASQPVRGN